MKHDGELLRAYVAAFEELDDLLVCHDLDPVALEELATGEKNHYGLKSWQPASFRTPRPALDEIYTKLPARFPPLYEELVLSYRWAEVDLGTYRLLANPPGSDLLGLLAEILSHEALWDELVPAGYLQFGKGPGVNYDPVCFDFRHPLGNGDCPVVQIDHEEILCNYRVKVVKTLATSFMDLY
jgi:hypothetical protein